MKKKILIISCVVLAAAVSCFGIYRAADSFLAKDTPEPGLEEAEIQPREDEEKNTVNEKTVSAKDETEVKAQPQASEPAEVPQEPAPQPETIDLENPPAEITLNMNGRQYEMSLLETTRATLGENKEHNVHLYVSDYEGGSRSRVEYDCETGEILYCRFVVPDVTETKITAEQARAIGEEFAGKHCDISQYTLDSVSDDEDDYCYSFNYSLHIDGYKSIQTVSISVTYEGKIASFNYKKYAFEGIDTNVKIDGEQTAALLDEEVKKGYGDDAEYKIIYRCVEADKENGQLVMLYVIDVTREDGTERNGFLIPIQQED